MFNNSLQCNWTIYTKNEFKRKSFIILFVYRINKFNNFKFSYSDVRKIIKILEKVNTIHDKIFFYN